MTDIASMNDEQIVEKALENSEVFGVLIDRYEAKLMRYILRISGVSPEDAEDICQDVFIKVYRNLRGFDTSLSFSSWIYRIAHNETRSYFRKHRRRLQETYSIDTDESSYDRLASDLETDGLTIKRERYSMLEKALALLPESHKEVLILHFLEEKSYKEISDILKKPMGSIATHIHRGKAKLKKVLAERGITPENI